MTTPGVRRAGNGSGKITRDVVLAAALEIIDRDGADALSMRRLRALTRPLQGRHATRPGPPAASPESPLPGRQPVQSIVQQHAHDIHRMRRLRPPAFLP
jgi:hypothetical protein